MKKCSFFSQNRKLVVIIVRGAFFIVEEVLSNCRSTGKVGLKYVTVWLSLVSYCFWYVLFYSILQSEMCGLRTDNHSGTRIDKRPYFVAW